jgi:hypothetical protein
LFLDSLVATLALYNIQRIKQNPKNLFFVTIAAIFHKPVKNRKLLNKLDPSPLKPFGQMNQNLVGSIYGKSSVVIAHFVMIH